MSDAYHFLPPVFSSPWHGGEFKSCRWQTFLLFFFLLFFFLFFFLPSLYPFIDMMPIMVVSCWRTRREVPSCRTPPSPFLSSLFSSFLLSLLPPFPAAGLALGKATAGIESSWWAAHFPPPPFFFSFFPLRDPFLFLLRLIGTRHRRIQMENIRKQLPPRKLSSSSLFFFSPFVFFFGIARRFICGYSRLITAHESGPPLFFLFFFLFFLFRFATADFEL